jgi:hypothetical protein
MRTLSPNALRSLLLGCLVLGPGCGSGDAFSNASDEHNPSFGDGADYMHADGGAGIDGGEPGSSDGTGGSVTVRLVHGLANVDELVVCYDPDYVADALDTPLDETDNGPSAPVELPLTGSFAGDAAYVDIHAEAHGALTFHRRVAPSSEADAGVSELDAGAPPAGDGDGDSAWPHDAGVDAGASHDAGTLADIWPAPVDGCDPHTMEALMPLPFTASWLNPVTPPDLPAHGVVSTLDTGDTVTLLASGFALNPDELAERSAEASAAYLKAHPGDVEGAYQAGHATGAALEAAYGPRVVPARTAVPPGQFALSFAHLVPDVPSDEGPSGALKLCVTVDDVEQSALPAHNGGYPFRMRSEIATTFEAKNTITFRAFVAELLDDEAKDCASTSLAPLAQLTVQASELSSDHSYTLVALGAVAPDALCNASVGGSLPRPSCNAGATALRQRMMLIRD